MIPLLYYLSFVSFGTLYMTIPSQNVTDISEFQYALLLLPSCQFCLFLQCLQKLTAGFEYLTQASPIRL